MKKTLFMHIGSHKTGTSYIQKSMFENQRQLAQMGLLYPSLTKNEDNHTRLSAFLRSNDLDRIQNFIDRFSNDPCDHFVLSSEEFYTDFRNEMRTNIHKDLLTEIFDVKIIVYLRRQDHMFESVFSQICKDWYCGNVENSKQYYEYHYNIVLNNAIQSFGHENVIVKPYNPRLWHENDIFKDFLFTLGISDTTKLTPSPRVNEGLPRREILALSQIEKTIETVGKITRSVKNAQIADDGLKFLTSNEFRTSFYEQYRQSNLEIAKNFGFENIDDLLGYSQPNTDWSPATPITDEEWDRVRKQFAKEGLGDLEIQSL